MKQFLTKTQFKTHFETMVLSIGFILNWIQNLRNFGIIKIGYKYFLIWLVNIVFKNTFSLENLMWSFNIKIIVYSKEGNK
jgi:hypothetical protein